MRNTGEEASTIPFQSSSKYSMIEDETATPQQIGKLFLPSKILRIKPLHDDSQAVIFEVEEVDVHTKRLQVEVQAGEFEVIREILRKSISTLSGADALQDIAVDSSKIDVAKSSRSQTPIGHQYSSSTGPIPF